VSGKNSNFLQSDLMLLNRLSSLCTTTALNKDVPFPWAYT